MSLLMTLKLMLPFLKWKTVLQSFTTVKGYFLVPIVVATASIDIVRSIKLLLVFMVVDFATGIGASYKEWRVKKEGYLISSEKLKMSGVKFALYASTILLAYYLEKIFFIKPFEFGFSKGSFNISIVVVAFWCVVEFYSIVFENFKRMGFDVVKKVTTIFKKYKSAKKEIAFDDKAELSNDNLEENEDYETK